MKKFLSLILLLLVTTTLTFCSSANFKNTKADYSIALITENGVKYGWVEIPSTFTFTKGKVKVKIGNSHFNFTQISKIMRGKTTSGYKYDYVVLKNDVDGTEVTLQVFNEEYFGIRLVEDSNNSIQFSN